LRVVLDNVPADRIDASARSTLANIAAFAPSPIRM
jgi:hypothetical protein